MKLLLILLLILPVSVLRAQLNDDFTDGDFTNDPVWTGSSAGADFIISENKLRSNSSAANSGYYLTTESRAALNVKWEFWVNLQFSTSGANYVDVYVMSDKADLKTPLINGYFIRIGNTDDEISLFKRSGATGTIVKLIDGVNSAVGSSNNAVKIRLTRDNAGLFTLEREVVAEGSSYLTEGSATDLSHTTSGYFGILIQQSTASFFLKHYFDNIKIAAITADTVPPALNSIAYIDPNTIEIVFSEAMDSTSVKTTSNYLINNLSGQALRVLTTSDPAKFHLKLTTVLNNGLNTVTVFNVADETGNPIGENNHKTSFYSKPYIAKYGDLVINEIFADPTPQVDLPSVEFAELRNNTDQLLSLKNWKFADAGSSATFGEINIEPHSLLIICAKADTAEYRSSGKILGLSPWPSLNNSGELLKLISPEDLVIDSVRYSDSWYRISAKKQGGWSLERRDPESKCQGKFNWLASVDTAGGTPGKENSVYIAQYDTLKMQADSLKRLSDTTLKVYFNKHFNSETLTAGNFELFPVAGKISSIVSDSESKEVTLIYDKKFQSGREYKLVISRIRDCSGNVIADSASLRFRTADPPPPVFEKADTARIIITEILADPSPEIGLPLAEFIEIYNPGPVAADLNKWTINDSSTRGLIADITIGPGEYLILCPVADTLLFKQFGKTKGIVPWPALGNSNDQLSLKSFKQRLVDSVAYSDKWYKDPMKRNGGWAMEKADILDKSCNGFYSWRASLDLSGGTPGQPNSISKPATSLQQLTIDSVRYTSDSTVTVHLNAIPDTLYLKPENFNVNNGVGIANAISVDHSYTILYLEFGAKFHEDIPYILTADLLISCRGVKAEAPNNQAAFTVPLVPELDYPLLINEVFADPAPSAGLPETEFIELYNPTENPVSLKGMSYGDKEHEYKFTSGEIAGKSFLILCPEKDTLDFIPFGNVIGLPSWPALGNDKDVLFLKNNKGREIHNVSYSAAWYRDAGKKSGGYSLEMIDPLSVCTGLLNWRASKDSTGGTPGRVNSVYSDSPPEPLKLVEMVQTDSITFLLTFNKAIDSISASVGTSYHFNNGLGNPVSVLPLSSDPGQVQLKLKEPPARGHTYRIEVKDIKDCRGRLIDPAFNHSDLILTMPILGNSVLINELLFNPRAGGVDFIELYNNTEHLLDLKDLSVATIIKDTISNSRPISNNQLLLEPGNYIAITSDPERLKSEYFVKDPSLIVKVPIPPLNDDFGTVVLLNNSIRIDQFNYTEKMHFQLLKTFEGVSLERSNFSVNTNAAGNFRSATAASGFATPGYKNSQSSTDPVSDDGITLLTNTFSPDNDGFEDLLQVVYRMPAPGMIANVKIFSDNGILIKNLLRNFTLDSQGTFTWDGLNESNALAGAGIYIIYAELFDTGGNVKQYRKPFVLAAKL